MNDLLVTAGATECTASGYARQTLATFTRTEDDTNDRVNLDYADVKTIMSRMGIAIMGTGIAAGSDRAKVAATAAISSPLLEASIEGARGILLTISGPSDLGLFEVNEAAQIIADAAHPDANIIFGTVIDDSLGDECRVTVIAAGFDRYEGERASTPLGLRSDEPFGVTDTDLGLDGDDRDVCGHDHDEHHDRRDLGGHWWDHSLDRRHQRSHDERLGLGLDFGLGRKGEQQLVLGLRRRREGRWHRG